MQLQTWAPSSSTVQAPQSPALQAHLGAGEPEIVAEGVGEAAKRRCRDPRPIPRSPWKAMALFFAHIMLPSSASVRAVSVRAASRR